MDRRTGRILGTGALVALLLGLGVLFGLSAHAATITVNTSLDLAPVNDGLCTLREAITNANTNSSPYSDDDRLADECERGRVTT